jgi:hypothetical protein
MPCVWLTSMIWENRGPHNYGKIFPIRTKNAPQVCVCEWIPLVFMRVRILNCWTCKYHELAGGQDMTSRRWPTKLVTSRGSRWRRLKKPCNFPSRYSQAVAGSQESITIFNTFQYHVAVRTQDDLVGIINALTTSSLKVPSQSNLLNLSISVWNDVFIIWIVEKLEKSASF